MKNDISWKRRRITVETNGIKVDADVVWWSKDYYVEIIKPHPKTIPGKHMMYMVPVRFVFDNTEAEDSNTRCVPILESCKKLIIAEYSQ